MTDERIRAVAHWFAIASSPRRQDILNHLRERGQVSVKDLQTDLSAGGSVVSNQLRILKSSGLVATAQRGGRKHYSLTDLGVKVASAPWPILGLLGRHSGSGGSGGTGSQG